ncbi:MAG: hypothetical protein AAF563_11785 [Pseudomonadota bacterium]
MDETAARIRRERGPVQLFLIALLIACVLVSGLIVIYSAFPLRPAFFVVNAQTEYLEIEGFDADSSIVLDGFAICYDAENAVGGPFQAPTPEDPCGAQEQLSGLRDGAALDIDPGSLAFVRRLNQGALEIVINGAIRSHEAGESGTWVLRTFEPLKHTIGFGLVASGWVHLGQIPDSGIEGVLLGGEMSAYQEGWFDRFLVNSKYLIAGDVIDIALSQDNVDTCLPRDKRTASDHGLGTNPIQGFFRFETPELEGLRVVVYILCTDQLNVERMGTYFPFKVSWTKRMLGDPFATAVLAFISWLGCLAAVFALIIGPIENRNRKQEPLEGPPPDRSSSAEDDRADGAAAENESTPPSGTLPNDAGSDPAKE